ncbi:cyclin-T2 isoform X2 [Atheta coriaria]|uniref:cyclin-T2 isoform X2 n=1 Tax=Dalotia coriaria TaxID=877792 RepID=UPI0031F3F1B6
MASDEKWYFTKEQLENTPSRQFGIDALKELTYRQQAAYFIQDMGQRLRVTQLCINTASVYMHRFYVFHSFTHFPWYSIAAAALFLAAKVEEQPRKLEHVIRVHNICKNPRDVSFGVNTERYQQQSQDLVFNENVLLQTLGFDVAIDHPHAHVVRCCHLVRASKDLAQTSYFMASTSLHLTTMCLQYKPTVVACFCIHLACKWSNWEIPLSNERREWFSYVDTSVTAELLAQLTDDFLSIFSRCPSRVKEKIMAYSDGPNINRNLSHSSSSESEARKAPLTESKDSHNRAHHHEKSGEDHKHRQRPLDSASSSSSGLASASSSSSSSQQQQREREYREKKERERQAHQKLQQQQQQHSSSGSKLPAGPHGHHRPPGDSKLKSHTRPNPLPPGRPEHREVPRDSDAQVRADKELIDKRYLSKPNSDTNNATNVGHAEHYSGEKRGVDTSRSRAPADAKLMAYKHDSRRPHDASGAKTELDARKHSSQSWFDSYNKNSMHPKQQPINNSTSQMKVKSPFAPENNAQKSVPKSSSSIKSEPHNGSNTSSSNSNGTYGFDQLDQQIKQEPKELPVKKPSMFSPEKTPPRKMNISIKMPPYDSSQHANQHIPSKKPSSNHGYDASRPIKKDQSEGFENLFRDAGLHTLSAMMTAGIPELDDYGTTGPMSNSGPIQFGNMMQTVPQQQAPPPKVSQPSFIPKDTKDSIETQSAYSYSSSASLSTSSLLSSTSQPIVNGIETNPTLISNLLKEAPPVLKLPTISGTVQEEPPTNDESKDKEHGHKDKKKKNKEKHKHKDKEKSREEKEKKRKHKDKDKEKHKSKNRDKDKPHGSDEPIKITISKDKIQHPPEVAPTPSVGLKIKIPKDKIKTEIIEPLPPPQSTPAIKIKISKEVINIGAAPDSGGKKRERDKNSSPGESPHKMSKYSRHHGGSMEKQNGRSSFGKVSEDEAMTMHSNRYSDTPIKYANKGTSGT